MSHLQQESGGIPPRATEIDDSAPGTRPRRSIFPTAKVTDASNSSKPALKSHKAAADAQRAEEARKVAELKAQQATDAAAESADIDAPAGPSGPPPTSLSHSSSQSRTQSASVSTDSEPEEFVRPPKGKRKATATADTLSEPSTDSNSIGRRKTRKKTSKRQKNKRSAAGGAAPSEGGIFSDIEVTGISSQPKARREDASSDVREFFDDSYIVTDADGKTRQYRNCKICSKKGPVVAIVHHNTTLRRHIESAHKGAYNQWCKSNNFTSKLPNARKEAKKASEDAHRTTQDTLDGHLRELAPERVIPYSNKVFCDAAIEWLIATDQPIQALEHPSFHKMIGIAARATKGVTIPNRRSAREEIMGMFRTQMTQLNNRLNSGAVTGEISLTCDAWQASNTDGYFAVTGHWIEEARPGVWEMHSTLLGFTRLNNAHNGRRLGGALFKTVDRLGIAHRIGHITCDNASNNNSMMEFFAKYIEARTKKSFPFEDRRIRCLAHVINLATQALIKGHSKAKYYSPTKPDEHVPDVDAIVRDEVGLIRAIAVKERSSAKRKELFRTIQSEKLIEKDCSDRPNSKNGCVKQLILDMPVRWSSTYGMLHRAVNLRESVDTFVSHMARDEPDRTKRAKLDALQLSNGEWERVNLFLSLLKHADAAQQAFSSDNGPSLHLALPSLEALHNAWSSRARKYKYHHFETPLDSAVETIAEYYDKTSTSDAFILSMLLHPKMKMRYFTQYWPEELHDDVRKSAKTIFRERHEKLSGELAASGTQKKYRGSHSRFRTLLYELDSSDSELSDGAPGTSAAFVDTTPAWSKDFNMYLNTTDEIPEGQTVVQWWGINAHRYPVWASLARDYLAIMASSVSSERAFSSAGITISKRRNRLKGDIVEALQCLKCMIHKNLIFRFDPTISVVDEIAEEDDMPSDIGDDIEPTSTNKESSSTFPGGWDENWQGLEDADDTEG